MASNKIRGITLEIGADTSAVVKDFKELESKSKRLQTQLNDVNRLLKLDPKNTELLAQKQQLLNDKIKNSKDSLEKLNKIQADMDKNGVDKNSEQYQALRREIKDTELRLQSLQEESKEVNKALGSITPGSGFDKIVNKADEVQKKLSKVSEKLIGIGKELSLKVTAPLSAAGAISFSYAADLEDAMGASEQIFKDSSNEVKNWADSLETYYGIAEGDALTYVNTMGAMLKNIGGLSESEAAKQSALLVELAGDLSAMFGGSTEDAVHALTGALKGNNTMLDNYGMGVNDATIKAKALEMGIYKGTGALELQAKQAATLALIMEQTSDAQGQAGRESEGASGSMKSFTTAVKNLSTDLGEVLLPIITPIINKLAQLANSFGGLDPAVKKVIVTVGLLAAAVGPILIAFGSVFGALSKIAGGVQVLMPLISKLAPIFTAIKGAVSGLFALIMAHPIIAIITAIIAAVVYLYTNVEWFRDGVNAIFANIGAVLKSAVDTIVSLFQSIIDFVSNNWQGILLFIVNPFAGAFKLLYDNFDWFKSFVDNAVRSVVGFFGNMWNGITSAINNIKTSVTNTFERIKNAIMNPIETAKNFVGKMIDKIKGFFNFKWELPKIKLPHFKVTGSANPLDWFTQGIPKIKVDWYADGAIFNSPTLIPSLGGVKGVGEYRTGGEVVTSIDKLKGWINDAIGGNQQEIVNVNYFVVDGDVIATKITPRVDKGMGDLVALSRRGMST